MAFTLNSDITIGRYKKVKPIEVKLSKTIYQFVQEATIVLPSLSLLKVNGFPLSFIETAKAITEGDAVKIDLGYNNKLHTEFIGFVCRINISSPIQIKCEGYSYQIRKKTYLKTFVKTKLLEILKFVIKGTDILLDEKTIPSFIIEKIVLANHNGVKALDMIKEISRGTISIFFRGNVLYAGFQFANLFSDVNYRLGWNVIKDNNLKLREAKNQDYAVHFKGNNKDGTIVKVSAAKNRSQGEIKNYTSHSVTDGKSLQQLADATLAKLSYDGYEGKITAFITPVCEAGDRVVLNDEKYPQRSGNYIADSIEVTFNKNGARRTVGIGHKL